MTTWKITTSKNDDSIEVQTLSALNFQFDQIPVFNPKTQLAWVSGHPVIAPLDLLEDFREPLKEFLIKQDVASFSMTEVVPADSDTYLKVTLAYLSNDLVRIHARDGMSVKQGETDATTE